MAFVDHVRRCNRHDLSGFRPWRVDGRRVGWVRHRLAERLAAWPEVFAVGGREIGLAPHLAGFEARSDALDGIVGALHEEGWIADRWGERFPVRPSLDEPAMLWMDRSAAALFGFLNSGFHLNGYVPSDGPPAEWGMWIARRARGKMSYPGELDQVVAGGQPIHLSLADNLVKECWEEAAIPPELARRARPVGMVTYAMEVEEGLKPDSIYVYDLALPAGFEPRNTDGEVESFTLMRVGDVADIVESGYEFKFNCSLVVIDFLIRHGVIRPDHPDYQALNQGLHAPHP